MDRIAVIGAGGHAKVLVAAWLEAGGQVEVILDRDPARIGEDFFGHRIMPQSNDALKDLAAVLAIGDNKTRAQLSGHLRPASWQTVIHPRAWVHGSAKIGAGTLICAGAVVQPDATIGEHAIINTGAIIEHDCRIGAFAHIGPSACLGGDVEAGDGAFVGLGAKVLPRKRLGDWAVVGGGACVTKDVAEKETVVGVPAAAI
ncbi:acetyltransferase [Tepidicaulis marinus]|nr:acetyltransferase [Tepidicaulis marinus]